MRKGSATLLPPMTPVLAKFKPRFTQAVAVVSQLNRFVLERGMQRRLLFSKQQQADSLEM
jgi:hypothetical protein